MSEEETREDWSEILSYLREKSRLENSQLVQRELQGRRQQDAILGMMGSAAGALGSLAQAGMSGTAISMLQEQAMSNLRQTAYPSDANYELRMRSMQNVQSVPVKISSEHGFVYGTRRCAYCRGAKYVSECDNCGAQEDL